MADLKVRVILDLLGNLPKKAKEYAREVGGIGGALRSFGRGAKAAFEGIRDAMHRIPLVGAIFSVAGLAAYLRKLGEVEESYERLGVAAGLTQEEVKQLKADIHDVAATPDIKMSAEALFAAAAKVVQKTGDLQFARDNLVNFALAGQATGADPDSIAAVAVEFKRLKLVKPEEIIRGLEIMKAMGEKGSFELKDTAQFGPQIFASGAMFGDTGEKGLRFQSALLQTAMDAKGEPSKAVTAYEAIYRDFLLKQDDLAKAGFSLRNKETGELRPMEDIIFDLLKRLNGNDAPLTKIFTAEDLPVMTSLVKQWRENNGRLPRFEEMRDVEPARGQISVDAARISEIYNARLTRTSDALLRIGETITYSGVVKEAVDALGTVANESAKFYEKQGLFGEEAWKRRKSDADKPPAPQPVPPAQKVEVEITVKGDKEAVKQIKQVVRETTGGMRK
jgi:hypothetical protein